MWWNSSSHGRHHSPSTAPVSPIPFSSNRELFEDPAADWVGDQLEQARLQRSGFYRRLNSTSRRVDDDTVALQKSRRMSPDGVDDTTSVSSYEPHTSWRFYTSFDNGEWTRHAVPVHKAEEATTKIRDYAQESRESGVKKSNCQAAESSLRRARHPRTTAADRQQARLRMRSGESCGESSVYGRWKLSSSAETFRNTTAGGSLTDLRRISPEVYHQSLNSLDAPQLLSPSSDRFSQWRETTSPVGLLPRPRLDSGSSSPKAALLPFGSCTVDGIDVTFQEKFIIPTKYKNRENNTAAGTPEISKTEVPRSTELESGYSNEVLVNSVEGTSASCMTGQGEVQAVELPEHMDVVLFDQVDSTLKETEESRVEIKPPGLASVKTNGALDFLCDLKQDQIAFASRFIQGESLDELSENCRIETDIEPSKALTTHWLQNGTNDISLNPALAHEKKEIILDENEKPCSGDTLSSKTTSDEAGNNVGSWSGRSLDDDLKRKQKSELTSDVATGLEMADHIVSKSVDKIVKFVSIFYADVNEDFNKESSNTKDTLSNFVVSDTIEESPAPVGLKVDPVAIEEDDNWVVEIAVKN